MQQTEDYCCKFLKRVQQTKGEKVKLIVHSWYQRIPTHILPTTHNYILFKSAASHLHTSCTTSGCSWLITNMHISCPNTYPIIFLCGERRARLSSLSINANPGKQLACFVYYTVWLSVCKSTKNGNIEMSKSSNKTLFKDD